MTYRKAASNLPTTCVWAKRGAAVLAFVMLTILPAMARADMHIGKFTVRFVEAVVHRNGDFVIPGAVDGHSSDGDFKADRAFGNYQRQDVTLVGHVVLHQHPAATRGPVASPMMLTSNQLRVEGKSGTYTATGSVVVVQGNRRLYSDYLQLNDMTHQGILRGNVRAQQSDRVVMTSEVQYNTLTGALLVSAPLSGFSRDSDFRADRAVGNNKAGTFTMMGDVIVHRFNYGKANNSTEPLTLWCDKLDIANHPQTTYTATGHVRVAQGDRTLVAPVLQLNDATHLATMTGGVHAEEPPDRTFDAKELIYDTQTQDFNALGGVKGTFGLKRGPMGGHSSYGNFKADRAVGNFQRQDVVLVGHVVLRQHPAGLRGPASPPLTLTSNQLRIEGKTGTYTATGSVVVVQGNRQLHSDRLQLKDRTHQAIARGHVRAQQNDRVVTTSEVHYNTLTGALLVPVPLSGFSTGSDFRADRAVGNNKAGTFTMVGNVIVHRFNYGKANNSTEPLTLWCDKLDIANRPQTTYTATGHVRVAQGDRTLVAPVLRLNDTTHIATMTGGVHGEEPPDRTFDAAELLYDTQTEDFKALGGVKATFPFKRGAFAPSPTPTATRAPQSLSPRATPAPTPVSSPTPRAS